MDREPHEGEAMCRRLVISPHADDAVLSAWQALADGAATVVTVFTGIPVGEHRLSDWDRGCGATDAAEQMRLRRAEDAAALGTCGARWVHLDFIDDQYRDGPAPHRAIVTALDAIVGDYDEVWFPAGIGGHRDHEAVARAAMDVRGTHRRVMYADLPYAGRAFADATVPVEGGGRMADSAFATLPLVPPRARRRPPSVRALDAGEQKAKRAALDCYESQLPALEPTFPGWWDDSGQFEWEWSWELPANPIPSDTGPAAGAGAAETESPVPFLSVLMRTQGKRPVPLRDALAGLAAQTDRDFEILVLAHEVTAEQRAGIDAQIEALPAWLRSVTAVVDVRGGGRSRPLNVGLEAARGRYVAVLDDDDLALPDWVEEFSWLASRNAGRVLRAGVLEVFLDGSAEPRPFPDDYDHVQHLVQNQSPICGVAFPRAELSGLGLRFDETLGVVEDWDLLIQAVSHLGVGTTPTITSHYQRWAGAEDSRTEHPHQTWADSERAVHAKQDSRPVVFPAGTAEALRRDRIQLHALREALTVSESELVRAEAELARTAGERADLLARLSQSSAREAHLTDVVNQFSTSVSWRVTAPLRTANAVVRRVRNRVRR